HIHVTDKLPDGSYDLQHGPMDWPWIVAHLRGNNFPGFLSVEYRGEDAMRVLAEDGKYMRRLL
ncbi:MAG: hypothetical protein WCJ56_13490, partial [bacterium]